VGHAGDDHPGLVEKQPVQVEGSLDVEEIVPAPLGTDLADDDRGDRVRGSCDLADAVEDRRPDLPLGCLEDLERNVESLFPPSFLDLVPFVWIEGDEERVLLSGAQGAGVAPGSERGGVDA
jgi:hypothetical protein